jgi:hypothetical protein
MASASAAVAGTVVVHIVLAHLPPGPGWILFLIRLYPEGLTFPAGLRQHSITFLERIGLTGYHRMA